jgi:hypothetical protein
LEGSIKPKKNFVNPKSQCRRSGLVAEMKGNLVAVNLVFSMLPGSVVAGTGIRLSKIDSIVGCLIVVEGHEEE